MLRVTPIELDDPGVAGWDQGHEPRCDQLLGTIASSGRRTRGKVEPETMLILPEVEDLVLPVKAVRVLTGIDAIVSRSRIGHRGTLPAAPFRDGGSNAPGVTFTARPCDRTL